MGILTGVVSLWLARIDSEDSLDNFTDIIYTEDGDYKSSIFGESFKIGYYDEDFKESVFLGEYSDCLDTLLVGFSYDRVIIPRLIKVVPDLQYSFNAIIMLYNYLYDGAVQECTVDGINCKFVCCTKYD